MPAKVTPTGQALLADFQTVFVSSATIEAAKLEAARSESELLSYLNQVSGNTYLNPGAIGQTAQPDVTRASLDAHIKKVQAQQLDSLNAAQLQALIEQDRQLYAKRRVTVTVLNPQDPPIEAIWYHDQTGYRSSVYRKRQIHGVIEEVLLDKNALLLRPSWSMRLLNSHLHNYVVYIIDPQTLQPMVDIAVN